MRNKSVYLFLWVLGLCAGCGTSGAEIPTPNFVTAILPTMPAPQTTSTAEMIPLAESTAPPTRSAPIEGTTTSELNVRAQTSTASAALGTVNIFTKVQIVGQDSTGSWYQILHAESFGWIRAEYVQVNHRDEIPIVATGNHSAAKFSALVVQKINVRGGAGTEFESVGALNAGDVAPVFGRDESGAWAQVEFVGAPDGTGWAAMEFLQIANADALPVIGEVSAPPTAQISLAAQDGDSMQSPLVVVEFSPLGAGALQWSGDLSGADVEDWLEFRARGSEILARATCAGAGLHLGLWSGAARVDDIMLPCAGEKIIRVTPNTIYQMSVSAADLLSRINYTINLEMVR